MYRTYLNVSKRYESGYIVTTRKRLIALHSTGLYSHSMSLLVQTKANLAKRAAYENVSGLREY